MSRKMKNSGVEWIGEIPEGWRLIPFKRTATLINGTAFKANELSETDAGYPIIRIQNLSKQDFFNINYCNTSDNKVFVEYGDLLFAWSGTLAAYRYQGPKAVLNQHIFKVSNQGPLTYWYLMAILASNAVITNGSGMSHITLKEINGWKMALPPLSEQQAIADYLDTKVGEIDTNISKLKSASALLSELKQSVIYEAVTGKTFEGKVIDRKMKDSGVEWIGEIPEEWNVSRMKHEFDMGMGKTILKSDLHEDGQIPVYSATEQDKLFGKIFTAELMLTRGDMVVSARGTIGSVKYITGESTCTQTTIYLKPKRYRSKFQYYYLLGARKHVFPYSDTAVPQLTITDLQAQFMITPPLSEQQAIADYLDRKVGEIDSKISIIERKIELLAELKQSVIYEAVTGKIDVRALEISA